ncbi:MAG: NUDIX domain-containing protein, partial [Halococcoides sp.]
MDDRDVVTVFVRHDGEILLARRSHAVGSYPGRWGTVAGHAEGDPASAIESELREEIGRTDWTLVRRGESHVVRDADLDIAWTVHPALVEVPDRTIDLDREHTIAEWVHPPAIARRPTVPRLWRSYERVRPTVETVASDQTHGSRELSLRALGALRDAAAATGRPEGPATLSVLLDRAADLATARPAMGAVTTRMDRAVTRGL